MSAYQTTIPSGNTLLSVDVTNINNNFKQLNTSFGIDHKPFTDGSAQLGYHTIVHLTNQTVDPPVTAAAGQLYAKQTTIPSSNDWQLFYHTPLGGIAQISGNQASTNGLCFASGIRFMWGQVNSPVQQSNTTVTFVSLGLPNYTNIYSMQISAASNPSVNNTKTVYIVSFTTTGFTYFSTAGSGEISSFYFLAIGN